MKYKICSGKYNRGSCPVYGKFAISLKEVTEEHFESLLNRYQIALKTLMEGIDFIFDCVHLLYYKCHKINPIRG